jgi:hypothetical protein
MMVAEAPAAPDPVLGFQGPASQVAPQMVHPEYSDPSALVCWSAAEKHFGQAIARSKKER